MSKAKNMATGGVLAALAVVVMCFGGFIPFMTYVCPVICLMMTYLVLKICGNQIGWTWYAAVCILSVLLSADKEAAAIYVAVGYYPIVKCKFDRCRFGAVLKVLFFNAVILLLYWFLMYVAGLTQLREEFRAAGTIMTLIVLVLGNVVFVTLDRILDRMEKKFK